MGLVRISLIFFILASVLATVGLVRDRVNLGRPRSLIALAGRSPCPSYPRNQNQVFSLERDQVAKALKDNLARQSCHPEPVESTGAFGPLWIGLNLNNLVFLISRDLRTDRIQLGLALLRQEFEDLTHLGKFFGWKIERT